jgi:Bacterial SH3 domain.
MKICPVCKANYNDDLNFCLNDGASLFSVPDEQETKVISFGENSDLPNLPNKKPQIYNRAPASGGKIVSLIVAIAAFFVLLSVAVAAAYFLIPESETVSKTQNNPLPEKEAEDIKEKKKTPEKPTPEKTASAKTPAGLNESGKVTARVAQTGDGFLALRTEPSVENGTRLEKIPSGAVVEIEDCQRNYQTISGKRGRWCLVTYEERLGWVFDAWLIY